MIYPEPDQTGVEAAREKYVAALAAKESTTAKVATARAAASEAKAARARLIRRAAAGEAVSAAEHAEAEAAEREAEAAVKRQELVLAAQESRVLAAQTAITEAQRLSHRARLIAAISERANAGGARTAALAALRDAEARMKVAHEVAMQAFGAGHPMPAELPKGVFHSAAEWEAGLWADSSPAAIRGLWGGLAAEALKPAA